MTRKITLLISSLLLLGFSLQAQSWKKLSKQADELYANGNYAQAAKVYEQAWQKKNKKKELIYKAGDAYHLLRDYPNAAKAYANVKDDTDDFPLAGLYYARSLKQEGNYDQAIREFRSFMDKYAGEERGILETIIQTEIEGAELGKIAAANQDQSIELIHLGAGVNTSENDFAATMGPDNNLFFSSTLGGTARIFQSELMGNSWSKGELPSNFPLINNGQFANPSLSEDGMRMYFTVCEDGRYGDLSTRCEIYFIDRSGGNWSTPIRLPDAINAASVTNTHPFVTQRNNTEFLFFSSNRSGPTAKGGMDIWYATRNLRMPGSEFSVPANLGAPVNTNGDEISPYYHIDDGRLFFSSNNHPALGGFDILVSKGAFSNWTQPVNLGMPYNSSADDYHYSEFNGGGFFSSNRIFGGEKLSTKDDDIFEFTSQSSDLGRYTGTVLDVSNGEPINYYTVTLYEVTEDGRLLQMDMQAVEQGRDGFSFEVLPQREFRIDVDAPGFQAGSQTFNTFDTSGEVYAQAIMLEPSNPTPPVVDNTDGTGTKPTTNPGNNTTTKPPVDNSPPAVVNNPGEPYTTAGVGAYDKAEYRTTAPKYEGTYYKIQLLAVSKFNANDKIYQDLLQLGDLETEYLTDRGIYRVLISAFLSPEEAKQMQQTAQGRGFPNAFVVKYQDGMRYGMIKLR
jgi:tetratricopeptide (TPR) repeat protein/cell division septation protein DedD